MTRKKVVFQKCHMATLHYDNAKQWRWQCNPNLTVFHILRDGCGLFSLFVFVFRLMMMIAVP